MNELWTMKQIAELLEVSKTTVQNAINDLKLSYDKKDAQKQYYGTEKFIAIVKRIKPDFDVISTLTNRQVSQQTDNIKEDMSDITGNQTDKPTIERIKIIDLENLVSKLQQDNKELKQQIQEKEKLITNLSLLLEQQQALTKSITESLKEEQRNAADTIKSLSQALTQQQQLSAADKRLMLGKEDITNREDAIVPEETTVVQNQPGPEDRGKTFVSFIKKIFK